MSKRHIKFGSPHFRYEWTIKRHSYTEDADDGWCEDDTKLVFIRKDLNGDELLESVIHEGIHMSFPCMAEAYVTQAARDIMALWKAVKGE